MPNRLAGQSSPYLLQHAHNPVDWHPWGPEAFALARERNVPIFLSIGYSTCYWCHVMERETFEDPAIGALLAANFVSIKLDREERPDVDDIYMAATVITTGHGGWPMSLFLEPETLMPFYCGTYFPPTPRHDLNRPSFRQVLEGLAQVWKEQPEGVRAQADEIASAVRAQMTESGAPVQLGAAQVSDAVAMLLAAFDTSHGGFGGAPKFPQPVYLELLLDTRAAVDADTRPALDRAVTLTLDAMSTRGLHDHLAGGFHRYCVDQTWTVPHFEKMLYDQAQLALVYARAARLYDAPRWAAIATRTLDFVLDELTGHDGMFLSAIDAEVGSREGLNYLWKPAEFEAILGPDAADAARVYSLDGPPNFRDPHHPGDVPAWVLGLNPSAADSIEPARLASIRQRLLSTRRARPSPRIDDKSIVSWNGMMIHAMAACAPLLDAPRYADAAFKAAQSLLRTHAAGVLTRTSRAGQASIPARLEDYAWLCRALFMLARVHPQAAALREKAHALLGEAKRIFVDPATHAAFDAPAADADLFVRPRSTHDGALPGSTAVLAHALIDAGEAGDPAGHDLASRILLACSDRISQSPTSCTHGVAAILRLMRLGQASLLAPPGLAAAGHAPITPRQTPKDMHASVQVFASEERLAIPQGKPATTTLLVRIAEGCHVIAADAEQTAASTSLTPFRVDVINGGGIAAYADYPASETLPANLGGAKVYHGEFELVVVLERTGPITGRPLLAVSFQACTATECQPPVMLELDIALDAD